MREGRVFQSRNFRHHLSSSCQASASGTIFNLAHGDITNNTLPGRRPIRIYHFGPLKCNALDI